MAVVLEQENSMYSLLTEEGKRAADLFIAFLLESQVSQDVLSVLKECREGRNLTGPFDNVVDLMRDLNA